MRTFERKSKAPQQTAPAKTTLPGLTHFGQSRQVNTTGNRVVGPLPDTNPDSLKRNLATPVKQPFAFDFSQIPVHSSEMVGTPLDASARTHVRAHVGLHQDDPLDASKSDPGGAAQPAVNPPVDDAQELSGSPKIAEVKIITGTAGAFSGFPIAKGIDLNVPGPFNDTKTTGSCVNVHQMQFRLSRGDPNEVKLIRGVIRVASAGGKEDRKGEKDKPANDGPSEGSVIRPKDSSSVVVADAPGFIGTGDASKSTGVFPVSYEADFQLFAQDLVDRRVLAKVEYTVSIAKKSLGDTAPKNELKIKSSSIN